MIESDDILLALKRDLYWRLLSDPFLAPVPVVMRDEHDLDRVAETILKGLQRREPGGRSGAVIIVHAVDVVGARQGNGPVPIMEGLVTIECSEHVRHNALGNGGTGISAAALVARVTQLLHGLHLPGRATGIRMAGENAILELVLEDGQRGYEVTFALDGICFGVYAAVAPVSIAVVDGVATLTCATSGAEIVYTLDGTYPGRENPASRVYVEAFEVATGDVIRAAGWKDGMNPSGVVSETAVG